MVFFFASHSQAGSLARWVKKWDNSLHFSQVDWVVRCWQLKDPDQNKVPTNEPSLSPGRQGRKLGIGLERKLLGPRS